MLTKKDVLKTLLMTGCLLLLTVFHSFLHEVSHTLTPLINGWRITKFKVFPEGLVVYHTGLEDADSRLHALSSLLGPLLPFLIIAVISLFYRYNDNHVFFRKLFGYFSYLAVIRSLSFTVGTAFYMFGYKITFDMYGNLSTAFDPYRFLYLSGFSPWIVLVISVLLIAGYVFILWKKNIFKAILTTPLKWYSMKSIAAVLSGFAVGVNIYYVVSFLAYR